MATLYLDHMNRSLPTLRDWLGGNWGLLLSHPSDFEDFSPERDRWLQVLTEGFHTARLRPIACRHAAGGPDRGWISALTGDERLVRLTRNEDADGAGRRLCDQVIGVSADHYAILVDASISCRFVLTYLPNMWHDAVSPLDLLGVAGSLRDGSDYRATDRRLSVSPILAAAPCNPDGIAIRAKGNLGGDRTLFAGDVISFNRARRRYRSIASTYESPKVHASQ